MSDKHNQKISRYVREKTLLIDLGISRSTLRRWEKDSLFPRRRRLGPNSVGWLLSEVEEWANSRNVIE